MLKIHKWINIDNMHGNQDERDMLAFLFRMIAETAGVDIIPSLQYYIPSLISIKETQHPRNRFGESEEAEKFICNRNSS